jgi:hypothetical protein
MLDFEFHMASFIGDFLTSMSGGVLTILKNISQWEGVSNNIPYIMENKKCSKPPTRCGLPVDQVDCLLLNGRFTDVWKPHVPRFWIGFNP